MHGIRTKEKNKWKKVLLCAVLFIALVFLANSVRKVYEKKREVDRALTQMKEEITELEKRGEYLDDSMQKLSTREGLEFEIRKKLNVAQAGEGVAIIVENDQSATTTQTRTPIWSQIKNFFTEIFE